MYYKPRIFISSLLKNRIEIRDKIRTILEKTGFEVLLYEKNLTPSTDLYTYRKNILDADYIIFVLDDNYGNKTDSGLSGTEEEYLIASSYNKPSHVYIKNASESEVDNNLTISDNNLFLDRIKTQGISYYLYKDELDLLTRITESVATIAGEIAVKKAFDNRISEDDIFKIALKHDYDLAIGFIAIYNTMIYEINNRDLIYSNLFTAFNDYNVEWWFYSAKYHFIDEKMNEMINEIFTYASEFIDRHVNEFTSVLSSSIEVKCPVYGVVSVCNCSSNKKIDNDWYRNKYKQYKDAFELFIKYVEAKKIKIDSLLHT